MDLYAACEMLEKERDALKHELSNTTAERDTLKAENEHLRASLNTLVEVSAKQQEVNEGCIAAAESFQADKNAAVKQLAVAKIWAKSQAREHEQALAVVRAELATMTTEAKQDYAWGTSMQTERNQLRTAVERARDLARTEHPECRERIVRGLDAALSAVGIDEPRQDNGYGTVPPRQSEHTTDLWTAASCAYAMYASEHQDCAVWEDLARLLRQEQPRAASTHEPDSISLGAQTDWCRAEANELCARGYNGMAYGTDIMFRLLYVLTHPNLSKEIREGKP